MSESDVYDEENSTCAFIVPLKKLMHTIEVVLSKHIDIKKRFQLLDGRSPISFVYMHMSHCFVSSKRSTLSVSPFFLTESYEKWCRWIQGPYSPIRLVESWTLAISQLCAVDQARQSMIECFVSGLVLISRLSEQKAKSIGSKLIREVKVFTCIA